MSNHPEAGSQVREGAAFTTEAIQFDALDYGAVALATMPHSVKIIIRGEHRNAAFAAAVSQATALEIPSRPNSVSADATSELIWLGPDELLYRLHTDTLTAGDTVQRLQHSLQGVHSAVVDVSDYYTTMQLNGAGAQRVLRKGTPLNLDDALSASDACAQTRFGHAAILLTQSGEGFTLQVRWTYAEYLWKYLAEAMQEYQR